MKYLVYAPKSLFIQLALCLLLLSAWVNSHSQTSIIDSLQQALQEAQQNTAKRNLLNDLCWEYRIVGEYDKAFEYGEQALEQAQDIGWKKGEGISLGSIGIIYFYQSNYPKALEYYFTSLRIREEIKDKKGIATSLNNIGLNNFPKVLTWKIYSYLNLNNKI